jgi:hypothetical protein
MKIKEALDRVNKTRSPELKFIDLGRALWPTSKTTTQRININSLAHGKTKSIPIEMVSKICDLLECDANYLFNIKPKK